MIKHDRKNWRFYARNAANKRVHAPITLAMANINRWAFGGTQFLDALKTVRISDRRIRSERREAIGLVGACLIDHTDLLTMRPVKISRNERSSLNVGLIATITLLHRKRVLRALDDLWRGGYLKIRREIRRPRGGEWRRNLHIDEVKPKMFQALGVPLSLFRNTIEYIREKSEKTIKKTVNHAGVQRISNLVTKAFSKKKPKRTSTIELAKAPTKAAPTKSIASFLEKYSARCNT
jgi:hypothetical protein